MSSHGLFIAGIVHSVAPDSEIYLIRVLEDDACGNLYSISNGIKEFMDRAVHDRDNGDIDGIVLNLSLGVHQPRRPRCFGLPREVTTLQNVIEHAISQGAIVVAAAGNDSWDRRSPARMEIPARDPGVIGVAASNVDRERSCFSNADRTEDELNVAAPGGDGVEGMIATKNNRQRKSPCTIPDCETDPKSCVISLALDPDDGYKYAYWAGTSFAAPLVSGQKALLFGPEPEAAALETICESPDKTLPNGIVNLQAHLGVGCSR